MSLIVHAYTREGGALQSVDTDPGQELFGFESARLELWAHPVMSSLGLALLPTLRKADIYAEGELLLTELEGEARRVLAQMAQVVAATKCGEEYVAFRLQNLLRAIARARELGGGVYIG